MSRESHTPRHSMNSVSCTHVLIPFSKTILIQQKLSNEGSAPLPFKIIQFSPILVPIDDTCHKYDPTVKNKPHQTPFLFPFLFFFLSGSLTPKSHMSYPFLCLSLFSLPFATATSSPSLEHGTRRR